MTKAEIRKVAAGYPKFVEWSDENGCFVGRCPGLFAGGIHGKDEAAVYKELCEAAEEWVEVMLNDELPLPQSRSSRQHSGKFMVRINPALHQRLVLKASLTGESLNSLVARALEKA